MREKLETIEELKVHLEEACHAAFHLKKLGVFDNHVYEQEFNGKIAFMESLVAVAEAVIRGDE
jgi:hypothetical protein|tara:strand:+ start:254 stop:442 length:189 start_codon:yes stop_codon:yes gene_type:complete